MANTVEKTEQVDILEEEKSQVRSDEYHSEV